MKLLNAFSLNMLSAYPVNVQIKEITLDEAAAIAIADHESCIGFESTASLFSGILGTQVLHNRVSVTLEKDETVMVGQYVGPRLAEGATTLPEGATLKWLLVTLN